MKFLLLSLLKAHNAYSNPTNPHSSPTILTGCAAGTPPIFGGNTSVVVFRFQKSTITAASFSGLSCDGIIVGFYKLVRGN
jgi:hypothetical protein